MAVELRGPSGEDILGRVGVMDAGAVQEAVASSSHPNSPTGYRQAVTSWTPWCLRRMGNGHPVTNGCTLGDVASNNHVALMGGAALLWSSKVLRLCFVTLRLCAMSEQLSGIS